MGPAYRKKPPSLEDVYRDHLDDVYAWFRRIGIPEHDMDDVAHKVFLELHGALPSYDPERPLKPWLKAIAVRTGWHHLGQSHNQYETLVEDFTAADEAPTSEERLCDEQRAQAVREVLATVDEVLALHEIHELAIEEIAAQLEVPVATLYSRRRRAIAQFKATWQRRHGGGAMGVVVPMGLDQSFRAGATPPGAQPPALPSERRDRLWKRLKDELDAAPAPPPSSPGSSPSGGAGGPSLGGPATSPLHLVGSLIRSRAAGGLLLFALGAASGAVVHAGLRAAPASAGDPSPGVSSSPPAAIVPREASTGAPILADPPRASTGRDGAPVGSPEPPVAAPRLAPTTSDAAKLPSKQPASTASAAVIASPLSKDTSAPLPGAGASSSGAIDPALAKEMQMILAAKAAELRGDFAAALANLEQHQRDFPRGVMAQEREKLLTRVRTQNGATP